jgi:hypothetical protein
MFSTKIRENRVSLRLNALRWEDLKSWVPKGACGFDARPRHFTSLALGSAPAAVLTDYTNNGKKSLGEAAIARPRHTFTPVHLSSSLSI